MLQVENADELIATAMAAETTTGNPTTVGIRVLSDGNETAIEVDIGPTSLRGDDNRIYIPIDSTLAGMLLSMGSMGLPGMPAIETTADPTALPVTSEA